jgi:hypothetical protein
MIPTVFTQREMEIIFQCLNGVLPTPDTLYMNIVLSEEYGEAVFKGNVIYGTSPARFETRLQSLTEQEAQDIIDASEAYWSKR